MFEFEMTIGGSKLPVKKEFAVVNPGTSGIAGKAPEATPDDLDRAVAAARKAFPAWSATSDEDRKAACRAVADAIEAHAEELAAIVTAEQGKTLNGLGSRWELGGAVAWARYTAELPLDPKPIQDDEAGRVQMHRKPLGVVGCITPWNFPVMIAVWHVLPALRSGNTVVLKPSPYTPLATLRFAQILDSVLPAGVVNCISASDGSADSIGARMSEHPDIDKIVFTGSSLTGRRVAAAAVGSLKRTTLEMSGNDAGIVLGDVDASAIAEPLFWAAFINNGQTCACLKRLYVHDDVYEDVCRELAAYAATVPCGPGTEESSQLGPVQNKAQFDKVAALVSAGAERGRLLVGGTAGEGLFYPPTIVADLANGDALVDEEQFGPALPIIRFSTIDEAVAAANDSDTGLGGSVWSSDPAAAAEVAARMECGSVWINAHGAIRPDAPFGGVKGSSVGVGFGEEGLHEYTSIQVVFG